MLREIPATRQNSLHTRKRWYTDSDMDLFIWYHDKAPVRFQLSYSKQVDEHAINWNSETGFSHSRIDSGEDQRHLKYKMSPVLLPDGEFNAPSIARKFLQASENIEESIADFIYARLLEYPEHPVKLSNVELAPEDL